jgi:hypothetical protein
MGSPPPDRDPRPKLALTSAPDPSAQIQQIFYCFTGECFLKNSNPNYTDHERKGKNKFNFFSENWVSQWLYVTVVRGLKRNIRDLQVCCNRCRFLSGSGMRSEWIS